MEGEIRMNAEVGIKGASRAVAGMAVLLLVAMAAGCGTATVVKPSGSSASRAAATPRTSVPKPGQTAVVRRGDTLYALARIHNITPGDLAAWNGLSNPNAIYPGQTLRLYPGGATATRPAAGSGSATATRPSAPPVSNPARVSRRCTSWISARVSARSPPGKGVMKGSPPSTRSPRWQTASA
ncbi:MAG: LysM domain-containing protein [Stenotrophomonas sp.]|nr:LysM domain-containing protein [Stenotrophomonas sp.]